MGSFWIKELCRVVTALSPPGWSDLWLSDVKRIFVGCVKQVGYKRSNSFQFFHTQLFERKKENEVTQSYPTLCHPMDCSLPGYSVHGIFHARVLEWVAMLMGLGQGVFPGSSDGKVSCLRWGRPGFDPRTGKIPWKWKWQPTPIFLHGKFHGQSSLVGYSPWDDKKSDTTKGLFFLSFLSFLFLSFLSFLSFPFLPFPSFLPSFLSFFLSTARCERIWIWHWQSFQLMDPSLLNGGSHMGPVYRGRLWPIYSTYSIWQNDGVHFDKAFFECLLYSMLVPGWTRYCYLVYLRFSQLPWKDYSHLTTGDTKSKES